MPGGSMPGGNMPGGNSPGCNMPGATLPAGKPAATQENIGGQYRIWGNALHVTAEQAVRIIWDWSKTLRPCQERRHQEMLYSPSKTCTPTKLHRRLHASISNMSNLLLRNHSARLGPLLAILTCGLMQPPFDCLWKSRNPNTSCLLTGRQSMCPTAGQAASVKQQHKMQEGKSMFATSTNEVSQAERNNFIQT